MEVNVMESVAIVGAGSIGVAWSVSFAISGYSVSLHDPDPERLAEAIREASAIVGQLHAYGLFDGMPDDASSRIRTEAGLRAAVRDASYVQECAPENVEMKRALFQKLGKLTSASTILASSSSAIAISNVVAGTPAADRALVVHPLNPPYLLRVAEVVASTETADWAISRVERLLISVGMTPLTISKELEGFLFNRLQGAILREAYCLVRDGVATVDQIDRAVVDGLGMRWSVLGVFETVDLNTRGGIASHAQKMGPAYQRMGAERGQHDPWTPDLVAKVVAERRAKLPLEQWASKVHWRDQELMAIAHLRRIRKPS